MLANQIRPKTISAAIVFRVHPFLAKKHRELPFLAIALQIMCNNKGLCVPVSILNPKSYVISTTNIGLILLLKIQHVE